MSIRDIGPLRAADEGLNHQLVDTFAIVAESERSWTEKVWVSIARTDGSLQLDFGLGKYHNRGIIDGFGGVSRGREQWTVRGSRELDSAPEASGFLLKTAGYGSWAGHIHGAWRGALELDGEYIEDGSDDEHLRLLGQFRDTPIRVREGDATGYGIMESIISGVWPDLGLGAESDHRVSYT